MSAPYVRQQCGAFAKREDDDRALEGVLDILHDGQTVSRIVLLLENEKDPEKIRLHLIIGPTDNIGIGPEERVFCGSVATGLLDLFGRALLASRGAVAREGKGCLCEHCTSVRVDVHDHR